ncbi:unnamed protein product [Amoebophrya sp. A120]|nr:unnamed protein product [Amoebophrya sp. A120]|eukprot:GSA120T00002385001.1
MTTPSYPCARLVSWSCRRQRGLLLIVSLATGTSFAMLPVERASRETTFAEGDALIDFPGDVLTETRTQEPPAGIQAGNLLQAHSVHGEESRDAHAQGRPQSPTSEGPSITGTKKEDADHAFDSQPIISDPEPFSMRNLLVDKPAEQIIPRGSAVEIATSMLEKHDFVDRGNKQRVPQAPFSAATQAPSARAPSVGPWVGSNNRGDPASLQGNNIGTASGFHERARLHYLAAREQARMQQHKRNAGSTRAISFQQQGVLAAERSATSAHGRESPMYAAPYLPAGAYGNVSPSGAQSQYGRSPSPEVTSRSRTVPQAQSGAESPTRGPDYVFQDDGVYHIGPTGEQTQTSDENSLLNVAERMTTGGEERAREQRNQTSSEDDQWTNEEVEKTNVALADAKKRKTEILAEELQLEAKILKLDKDKLGVEQEEDTLQVKRVRLLQKEGVLTPVSSGTEDDGSGGSPESSTMKFVRTMNLVVLGVVGTLVLAFMLYLWLDSSGPAIAPAGAPANPVPVTPAATGPRGPVRPAAGTTSAFQGAGNRLPSGGTGGGNAAGGGPAFGPPVDQEQQPPRAMAPGEDTDFSFDEDSERGGAERTN